MRVILDNIIFFLQRSGGGTVYWTEIIKRANNDEVLDAIFSEPTAKHNNVFRAGLPIKITYLEKFPLLLLRISNFTVPINEKAIFHSSYYRISKSPNAINIITIHDFTSELFFTGIRKFVHSKRKWNGIKNADGIICISNNTKADLLKFYPDINENKIRVIYNGVGDEYFPLSKSSFSYNDYAKELGDKYVLYIGHRTSYKNFYLAAKTVALLDESFSLLIVGEKLSNSEVEQLDEILKNRYTCLNNIDNKTLNVFYNFAFCLIYPSIYEGFGIPIVEAMKAGCPVVTSDKSSIPEVAGDAALIVNEITADNFAKAIMKLQDLSFRDKVIKRGVIQAKKFSWDKCFNEVKQFYKDIYKG
ncbi:MAG: glycosyltransferase family 4 protein [Mucilaginibacter sp.]